MFSEPRFVRELKATDGIGDVKLLAFGFLIVMAVTAWFFSRGDFLIGLIVIGWYGLSTRTRFIGPYLGFELERWEDQRDLD